MKSVIYWYQMSGYELNDKDTQVVLRHLRSVRPGATKEQAEEMLLKAKMDARSIGLDNPDSLIEYYDELFGDSKN